MTIAIGHDGAITMPSGHHAHLRDWSANVTRVSSDITGFGDDARRRRLGVQDIQGTARGHPEFGSASTEPGTDGTDPGGSLTLTIATGCTLQAEVVLGGINFNCVKDGDSTLEFNFENGDGEEVTETWATA